MRHMFIIATTKLLTVFLNSFKFCIAKLSNFMSTGVEFSFIPETHGVPLVADMSSNILSRPFDIKKVLKRFKIFSKNPHTIRFLFSLG